MSPASSPVSPFEWARDSWRPEDHLSYGFPRFHASMSCCRSLSAAGA